MKAKKLKIALMVILLVLILGSVIVVASGSAPIYLLAVNDNVFRMTEENMPLVFNGQLYIPYTMISTQATGVNLGVRANYAPNWGTLTITDGVKTITFNLIKNTVTDEAGNIVFVTALVRDSMVYIPIDWLCKNLGDLIYSLTSTPYGILVRIYNNSAVLTNTEFVDAADTLLRQNFQDYQNSKKAEDPIPTISQSPLPTTPEPVAVMKMCLAFRVGELTDETVRIFEENGHRGLFFFTCRELVENDDLVRRLIARGHQVGLRITGNSIEGGLSQLEHGAELLKIIARSPLLIVSAEEISEEEKEALHECGVVIWKGNIDTEESTVSDVLEQIKMDEMTYIEIICDSNGLKVLDEILYRVRDKIYYLEQALVSVLQ